MNHKTLALAAAALLGMSAAAHAQIVPGATPIPDTIRVGQVFTCNANTSYQLVNTVRVYGLISIEPGAIIYGNKNGVRSCLEVEPGGKIYAVGTPKAPIIFTSSAAQGQKAPGDWGGVILLGNAVVNVPGGIGTIEGGTNGTFGGNNDADSSGVMKYCRIEFAGIAFSPNNEINGLTMGGVGNKTVIDHIQVSYSNDDSYEWFGGDVNAHHLIAFRGLDDDFDTDNGFRGHLQFLFGLRDSSLSDVANPTGGASNGMEADNDANGSLNTPFSNPVISNLTDVGPYHDTNSVITGQAFARAGHWRRNTHYGLFNSVLTGYQEGIRLEGTGTLGDASGIDDLIAGANACPQPTNLRVRNTVVTGKASIVRGQGNASQTDADAWFNCAAMGNVRGGDHSGAGLRAVSQADLENPDPRPLPASVSATGTDFTDGLLTGNNFTFTTTTYKGAFDPNGARNQQWDSSWTNYKPNKTTYVKHRSGWALVGLANTPASANKDSIYHNSGSNAFRYNNGYTVDNTLDAGVGYWLLLNDNSTIEQIGAPVSLPRTVNVVAGWNLVNSGASQSAAVANITVSGTTVLSNYFGFDNGYFNATTIEPGKAYWVNVSANGTITFH